MPIFPQCRRHEGPEGTTNLFLSIAFVLQMAGDLSKASRCVKKQKNKTSNTIVLKNGRTGFDHKAVADAQLS